MTLDTYADLFDDDLDAVSDRLDATRASRIAALVNFEGGSASVVRGADAGATPAR
jgi:hypothetical protein